MKNQLFFLLLIIALLSCACGPEILPEAILERDVKSPMISSFSLESETSVALVFDEEIQITKAQVSLDSPEAIENVTSDGVKAQIVFAENLTAGKEYTLSASAFDLAGNSTNFSIKFSGLNAFIPEVLINEVRTDSSGLKTDLIEFVFLSDGNLAGMKVFTETKSMDAPSFTFPSLDVAKGDFLILHMKKTGIEGELNELEKKDYANSVDTNTNAWDLFCETALPLSKNNGAIFLYDHGVGKIVDAFLYTNRTSASDTKYSGFGSTTFKESALTAQNENAWLFEGENASPEDCIASENITAARSFCRSSTSTDTNGKTDFHIVPTGKTTFGAVNSDDVYVK